MTNYFRHVTIGTVPHVETMATDWLQPDCCTDSPYMLTIYPTICYMPASNLNWNLLYKRCVFINPIQMIFQMYTNTPIPKSAGRFSYNIQSNALQIFKGLRPVLEGFVVTMHEGACETGSQIPRALARGIWCTVRTSPSALWQQTPTDRS